MLTTPLWGCAKCATLGKTCCPICEVLVTVGDRQRITLFTRRIDFWEHRIPADPRYLHEADDHNWLRWAFRPDGSQPLPKRPGGTCTFLGRDGCNLPVEVRPLVCWLYPYNYTEAGLNRVCNDCPPGGGSSGPDHPEDARHVSRRCYTLASYALQRTADQRTLR